jgi:hypothetical protein
MRVDRILITGDFFRTTEKRDPTQLSNVLWLYNLVRDSLLQATGMQAAIWFGEHAVEKRTEFHTLQIPPAIFQTMGFEPSMAGWMMTYFSEPTEELVELVRREFAESLVLCVEMSPIIQSIFDRLDLPWIDINISPLRFLEDLCVSFRFSRHFKLEGFNEYFLSQEDIDSRASRLRQFYADVRLDYEDAVIFFAQTEVDRTLLTANGLYDINDALVEMQKLIQGRPVFIKPHPFSPANPIVEKLRTKFGARCIDENTYALLASGIDCEFATISSSVGYEARAFCKNTSIFNEGILQWINSGPISLTCYRDSRFWAKLLASVLPTKTVESAPVAIEPNLLRKQLSSFSLDPRIWEVAY